MKEFTLYLILGLFIYTGTSFNQEDLDMVSIYLNNKLGGTWRADDGQLVHINRIAENDTLIFRARSDVGGLGNSSIDIKDNSGVLIDNIQNPSNDQYAADFIYVLHFAKIDTNKVSALEVFLNVDPSRNLPPPNIASVSVGEK